MAPSGRKLVVVIIIVVVVVFAAAWLAPLSLPHPLRRGLGLSRSLPQGAAATAAAPLLPPPPPVLPLPSAGQLQWQRREMIMFLHFGMNTFADCETGDGRDDPRLFDPTALNVSQWVETAKQAGFKGVILTAKHADGFNLWPSKLTNYSVASSPWRGGKGNLVREVSEEASRAGLAFGLYNSPLDNHEATYGDTEGYNKFYLGQWRELLTGYGPISEVWFDGAIPHAPHFSYDIRAWFDLPARLQPSAVVFSGIGPGVRWVGNERGEAGETCWSTFDASKSDVAGFNTSYLNAGDPDGPDWIPAECDVTLHDGWFWHEGERPKSLAKLLDIFFQSVGRNCVLLLNVPPNRDGLFSGQDVDRLMEFRDALKNIFGQNLAEGGRASASSVWGGEGLRYAAANVLSDNFDSFWAAEEGSLESSLEVTLPEKRTVNLLEVREPIALGQRVANFRLDALVAGQWAVLFRGSTIGYRRLCHFDAVETQAMRIVISKARGAPLLSYFALFFDPYAQGSVVAIDSKADRVAEM